MNNSIYFNPTTQKHEDLTLTSDSALPVGVLASPAYDDENQQSPVRLEFDSTSTRNIGADTVCKYSPAMGVHVCVVTPSATAGDIITFYDTTTTAAAAAANAVCSVDLTVVGPTHIPHVFASGVVVKCANWHSAKISVGVI